MSAQVQLTRDAQQLMERAAQFKAISPVVQRYEVDVRVERCNVALEIMRIEWRRCSMGSGGIIAEVDSLFEAATALKNHVAHLRACRP